jgi:hypothetical protein
MYQPLAMIFRQTEVTFSLFDFLKSYYFNGIVEPGDHADQRHTIPRLTIS